MRLARPLAAVAAPALGVMMACGGSGTSTTNPLVSWEPAPSGMDPAPPSGDTPPSSWDQPPASGDPAPQSGGCIACTGSYSCSDGDAGSVTITLTPDNDSCDVQIGGNTIATIVACGEASLPGANGENDAGATSYTVESNGTVTSCPSSGTGTEGCIVCTPTTAQSSGPDASVIVGKEPTPSSAGECSTLMSCCSTLSSALQPGCNSVVNDGNASVCASALTAYACH